MAETLDRAVQLQWRKFIATESGTRGLLWWREQIPSVIKGPADEMIFDAGVAEGYKRALDNLSFVLGAEATKDVNPSND
jgi:hypothetical protein